MLILCCFFQYWQRNGEGSALSKFALALDVALVEVDDLLDVSQSETKALDVVDITSMHSVELVEDLLHVLLLDAQTCITDAEAETLLLVPGTDIKIERLIWLAILHSVVHQVGDSILEVYLVDEDSRIHSLDLRIDMTSSMFHSQRECRGNVLQQLVEVEFLLLE